jgi:hypothetical protein
VSEPISTSSTVEQLQAALIKMDTIDNVQVTNLQNTVTNTMHRDRICTDEAGKAATFKVTFLAPSGDVPNLQFIYSGTYLPTR